MEELVDFSTLIINLKTIGQLQRNWIDMHKKSSSVNSKYIKNGVINESNQYLISNYTSKSDFNNYSIDEYGFLPFIQKDGIIKGSSIRDEYIRNSLRDMVAYFASGKDYKMNLVNDGIFKCLDFFANETKNYDYCEGNFFFSEYIYKKFRGKVGDLQKYYTKTETNDYYQIDFIKEPQMLYGYGKNSLTTRGTPPIKVMRGSDTGGKKFSEILRIILPDIKVDNNYYIIDETIPEFETNKKKLHYTKGRVISGGVMSNLGKGTYKYKIEYKYGESKKGKVHLGYDISYGVENAINYSHPPVYSPVNGEVRECANGRVVIMSTFTKKVIDSNKKESTTTVYYFHVLEHLIALKSLSPWKDDKGHMHFNSVKVGDKLGLMGGVNLKGQTVYTQHVHYSMFANNKFITGATTKPIINGSGYSMGTKMDIILNPKAFWDNGKEEGNQDYRTKQQIGGAD